MKTMNWLVVVLACLVAAGCAGSQSSPAPGEETGVEASALHLRNGRLFISAAVNGSETQALLDSGAEMSLLDAGFARSLGLASAGGDIVKGSGGTEEVSFAPGVSVSAVGLQLDDMTVAVLDLSDISARLIGEKLTMILGREIFDAARLRIDIQQGRIETVSRESHPQGVAFTLVQQHGIETFPVLVNGAESALAEFDLGNGSEVMISAAFAEKLGLLAEDRIVEKRMGGGIGGAIERDIVLIPSLTVAGVIFKNVEAAVDRTGNAAAINLGVSVLRNFLITADFAERRLWLQPFD